MEVHDHDHKHCQCHKQVLSVVQSLDELDFLKSACSAAQKGDVHRLMHLLGRHAQSVDDDGVGGGSGYTPLHYASRAGQAAAAQLLLNSGADPNKATRASLATPLHRAAYMGHTDIVNLLLNHKANGLLQDADGQTPLHKAVAQEAFPDAVHLADKYGVTPNQGREG